MKRLLTAALAAATFAAPLSAGVAAADPYDHGRHDRGDHDRGRGWGRDDRGRHDWDDRRYNGYTYQNRWYYGRPPVSYYGWEPGYRDWRRGDRLPAYYRSRYGEVDWRYYHLRPPPRGYHYVRDDRGGYLLVGIATGVILGSILSDRY